MRRSLQADSHRRTHARQGSALLLTMMVLLLVSLLAVTGLKRSGEESTSGARLRSSTRTLHAADSGIQLALSRLSQTPPDLTPFGITLAGGASVESRRRVELVPQQIQQLGLGVPAEGFALNQGAGVHSTTRVFRINTTAESGGSTVELEAKLIRTAADAGGY